MQYTIIMCDNNIFNNLIFLYVSILYFRGWVSKYLLLMDIPNKLYKWYNSIIIEIQIEINKASKIKTLWIIAGETKCLLFTNWYIYIGLYVYFFIQTTKKYRTIEFILGKNIKI